MGSLPRSVTPSVPSSTRSVEILEEPQLGPHHPMSGSAVIPVVPRSDDITSRNVHHQPVFGHARSHSDIPGSMPSAPSVPVRGFLFRKHSIDPHYLSEYEGKDPVAKVNNPPTRGMLTWVKLFQNHIAFSQRTDETGMKINGDQQRTSYMRITPPPHGGGYAPQTFTPRQLPQNVRTQRFIPVTGTDPYGTGVLNSDVLGAGQTAGGIGGNQYTPQPGPPSTTSTAGNQYGTSGMPTWG